MTWNDKLATVLKKNELTYVSHQSYMLVILENLCCFRAIFNFENSKEITVNHIELIDKMI